MKSARLLAQLQLQLTELAHALAPVAQQRSACARFDNHLFHTHSTQLGGYLQETEVTMQLLRQAVNSGHSEQVAWMAEQLVAQIGALQRELATQKMRTSERPAAVPTLNLYEKLSQHQGFERRLQQMIAEREMQRQQPGNNVIAVQREIAALEGRLQRCRDALKRIERNIEWRERQG